MSEDPDYAARRTSFGRVAEVYERTRPGYGGDAVAWLAGPPPLDVVDVGAGTGKLTRALLAAGHRVTAVEPQQAMLDQLRAAVPGARALLGTAEDIPLPDASADIVTAGQAWHWVDAARAVPEVARVLRAGGQLALVWNLRDEAQPWTAALSGVIGSEDARAVGGPGVEEVAPLGEPFSPWERTVLSSEQRLDRDALRGLVASRSYVELMPPEERGLVMQRLDGIVTTFADHDGMLDLRYDVVCYRAVLDS